MLPNIRIWLVVSGLAIALIAAAPARAADAKGWTVRVGLGPKMGPKYPGSDEIKLMIYPLISARHTGDPLTPGGPGNSPGIAIIDRSGFKFGPVAMISPKRHAKDVGAPFARVERALELGVFAQYSLLPELRVRVEARHALWEYEGWVGQVSADYIIRDRDTFTITIGPRLRIAGKKYMRTYYGVTADEAAASGLPEYAPDGGAAAVSAATGVNYQFTYHWGIRAVARYERLIGNAGNSPIVEARGSPDQYRAGLALTYTFDIGKLF